MPKLSVIVPVYNTEKYLRECIDSILAQTFTDFELILVDDGSTDGSGAICDEYAKKDERIRVIHQENGGATAARRSGVQFAGGEYITFVDSDDWIEQCMYWEMLELADTYNADMVLSGMILERQKDNMVICTSNLSGLFNEDQIRRQICSVMLFDFSTHIPGLSLNLCNKLIKNSLLKYAFSELPDEITYGEDVLGSAICLLNAKCIYIMKNSAAYHYRQTTEFRLRERNVSILPRLSRFALVSQCCLVKNGFNDMDQLGCYVAQVSLYCIRHILLFNTDYTLQQKIRMVNDYLQEQHIRKLMKKAKTLVTDKKMRRKLCLVNRNRVFVLLLLFAGKEIVLRIKGCLMHK